jgi:hypothetical protein
MAARLTYTRMAQAAVIAAATGLYLKQNRKLTALTLGVLGSAVLEVAGKAINYSYHEFFKWYKYKVGAFRSFDPVKNSGALRGAIERIKTEFPEQYQCYLEKETLTDALIAEHLTKKLQQGCCAGTANAIFDRIIRRQSFSFRDSAPLIRDEEVFYFQILQHFVRSILQCDSLDVEMGKRLYKNGKELLSSEKEKSRFMPTSLCEFFVTELEELNKDIEKRRAFSSELLKDYHFKHFLDSDPFLGFSSVDTYQTVLEKAMRKFPEERDFVGVLNLPEHVLSFQFGPKGYFIYDSYNPSKGLFSYSDTTTFFQELMNHAIYDLSHIKHTYLKKQDPKIPTKTEDMLKKYEIYFSIRPLDKIYTSS